MIKIKLESLDKNFITVRTGKFSVLAEINNLPEENKQLFCMYLDEDCESPGVVIYPYGIEKLENEIKFFDYDNRPFKITLLD